MRKTIRHVAVSAVAAVVLTAVHPAVAHETRRFTACAVLSAGCYLDAGVRSGDRVKVRAVVRPVHAGYEARVLRRDPHSDRWMRVGTVTVSDTGRMRYVWRTRYRDAVQDAPYLFRFKIPGHGKSNSVAVYVSE